LYLRFNKKKEKKKSTTLNYYDKEKYKEMILDTAETVLGFLLQSAFETVYTM
jgi:hypothetical protein